MLEEPEKPYETWWRINSTLERIRVPGGFLYRGDAPRRFMVFVPEPEEC